MQTPYQQLPHPQFAPYPVSAPSSSYESCCPGCGECGGCCAKPAYCLEPAGCCTRAGACPCFCTGSTAAFSVALCAIWLALPMLITAMAVTDMFEVSVYGTYVVFLGLWQVCGFESSFYQCRSYSDDDLNAAFSGAAQFNALRALTLVSAALTLLTGILAAIRLSRQQRSKPSSNGLNLSTLLCGLLALGSAGAAFGLTFPLNGELNDASSAASMSMSGTTWGLSWIFLIVGLGLLLKGVTLHLIAHCCYQRKNATAANDELGEQPGLYVPGYPAAPIFTHPQPLHPAPLLPPALYYPTASAMHYPPPQYVQQPPMGHIYQ